MTEKESAPVAAAEAEEAHEHDQGEHEHEEHDHEHEYPGISHADERRAHQASMQCWRLGQRARTADDWRRAVEQGEEAIRLCAPAPEPHFNLAVAYAGLAAASGDAEARAAAARTFDQGLALVQDPAKAQYASTAASLLEKRSELSAEPAYHYGLGLHLALLGRAVRARRALAAAAEDPTVGEAAKALLETVPEPAAPRAAPVGRNDPCPCGSGKKYKKCHGAAA